MPRSQLTQLSKSGQCFNHKISASSRNSNVLNYEKEHALYLLFLTVSFTFVSFEHRDQNLKVTVVILMNAQVLVDM